MPKEKSPARKSDRSAQPNGAASAADQPAVGLHDEPAQEMQRIAHMAMWNRMNGRNDTANPFSRRPRKS